MYEKLYHGAVEPYGAYEDIQTKSPGEKRPGFCHNHVAEQFYAATAVFSETALIG